jgi:hypothetical protein
LQVQRFFQFQCPQLWKFLESAYRDNGEIVGAKLYGLQSRKMGCWIVVREHELKPREETELNIRMGESEESYAERFTPRDTFSSITLEENIS